ncbi:carbohydrate ABC transporter permease [Verminephrobacter aporrectodeae]|uniref:carbohydrate ABC transporter permease n=1 Tax=Verminephrobacter aporrectodeae TaxID=1110389 RepID=UPI0022436B7A|nr:carbohydrate ABC transporter permease [Verminephrobacter aporrectodeae]MCW8174308.1 carbohydrate ABC transporter permease [Verminephrobacter aporrectodeae subsp. tuberculatae]MCW8202148.1 carbohydrate ABC transporter permease [Verminephrobacter aporrectodeae subsp. tuberculatae]
MSRGYSLLRWGVFLSVALLFNLPVISTAVTALKSAAEMGTNPGFWIEQPTLNNLRVVLTVSERLNVYGFLKNSLIAALIGSVLPIVLSLPAAYAMVRRGVGSHVLLPLVVNLRAMPLIIFAIPLYMAYQYLGLLDTPWGLGLILAVVNLPLSLMLVVNAVSEIPLEMDEAAQMDGARMRHMLWQIVVPICRPSLATALVFGFINAWNEFLFGLMLTTRDAVPMTVGASFFFASGGGGVDWGLAAAVILVACLPPMVLGLLMYRQISSSMLAGAVKG